MASQRKSDKLYRIGEVARMTGLQQFVLRFWEKEFRLKLPKAKSGHRFYRQEDIQTILTIKRLLYTEGYTIKGAQHKLSWNEGDLEVGLLKNISPREANYRKVLRQVQGDLRHLLEELRTKQP